MNRSNSIPTLSYKDQLSAFMSLAIGGLRCLLCFPANVPPFKLSKYGHNNLWSLIRSLLAGWQRRHRMQRFQEEADWGEVICTSILCTCRIIASFSIILHMSFYPMQMGRLEFCRTTCWQQTGCLLIQRASTNREHGPNAKSPTRPGCL